jgi:hypothetical protein
LKDFDRERDTIFEVHPFTKQLGWSVLAMTTLPTIVFVPGACHTPEFFGPVISILEPLGYKCVTVSMPAVGKTKPVDSLDEDIAAIRTVVLKELDAGLDVIMNVHSWGGIPTNSALDGLSKAEREKDGKTGAVVKMTFVASFVLPENTSLLDAIGGVVPDFCDIQEVRKIQMIVQSAVITSAGWKYLLR